jgi:hypothetical protein
VEPRAAQGAVMSGGAKEAFYRLGLESGGIGRWEVGGGV